MRLSKHFRFHLWWESVFNWGHFSTCRTRKKMDPCDIFSTHETHFSTARGSYLYDEKWPQGRFSTGVIFVVTPAPPLQSHEAQDMFVPLQKQLHQLQKYLDPPLHNRPQPDPPI